jgi:hypothetical protein
MDGPVAGPFQWRMMWWTAPALRHRSAIGGCVETNHIEGRVRFSTIGVDIAKSVFQVHGVDTDGTVVISWMKLAEE